MSRSEPTAAENKRRVERQPLDDDVTIGIQAQDLVGPGKNVSAQGVHFTTQAAVRVKVRIAGEDRTVDGELVRIETMGDGSIGIAVRFLPATPAGARTA